jgi:hypothetical protein
MSLFSAMADEGSVWAQGSSLFNISSPLNDLLEKDDFTLEQVLQEDELVQEVKTRNTKLLDLYVAVSPPPTGPRGASLSGAFVNLIFGPYYDPVCRRRPSCRSSSSTW